MYNVTMDLFAGLEEESRPTGAASPAMPKVDFTPILEAAFADSGRKAAMKSLTPEDKEALVAAVGVVSVAKCAAYRRAVAGELLPSFDWLARQPALASATALLNLHFVDSGVIPMATG